MKNTQYFLLALILAAFPGRAAADLAVIEKVSGLVSFYTNSGTRLAQVQVGVHPHEMIYSLDKRHIYVTNNNILWMTEPGGGGNTISIIDVDAMQESGVIDLKTYRRPHGIALDPNSGLMVVTIENPDGLLLIDPLERRILKVFDTKGKAPHMVTLGPKGKRAYVSNTGTATLAAVDLETGEVELAPTGARPQGSVMSQDGRICYVTNYGGSSVSVIDTETMQSVERIETGRAPVRIELAPDGKTLVYATYEDEGVGFIDIAEKKEVRRVDLDGKPVSLTLSQNGELAFASAQENDKIFVLSVPQRKLLRIMEMPKGAGPDPVLEIE